MGSGIPQTACRAEPFEGGTFAPQGDAPSSDRNEVLAAVTYMAEELLRPGHWLDRLLPSLGRLGRSLGAARLHVLQNVLDDRGRLSITCVGGWIRPGTTVVPCTAGEICSYDDLGLQRWRRVLSEGGAIVGPVCDLPEPECTSIGTQGTLSVATVPIFAGDEWWGLIGLDDCDAARIWTSEERECLSTAARLIGAGIRREAADAAIAEMAALERAIIDESPIGISVRSHTGRLLRYNPAWQRIWAMTDEDVRDDLSRPRDHLSLDASDSYLGEYAEAVQGVYTTGGVAFVPEVRTVGARAGAAEWVSQRFYALTDASGEVARVVVLTEDVSARRRAEEEALRLVEELKRSAQDLEIRVEARTAELKNINEELQAFTYSVSHDLRAPLRIMDGFSLALMEDFFECLPAEAQRYALRVRESAREMSALIDRMLELSRLSRRVVERGIVRLNDVVAEALDELRSEIAGRDVRIHVADLGERKADPLLLRHVYLNLISNALKFTRNTPGAEISVGVADGVYFVQDNGAGFPMAYADKLFKPFQRLHAASDYEGTGVGLAIVRRVIASHGGRVWARGAEDEGACFYFTLDQGEDTETPSGDTRELGW
ncbi:MAG: GAF domain-containing protein [Armatimonadetes bacterium]|nr:GAF domain-containing protein [Armatimonadota bacterium]